MNELLRSIKADLLSRHMLALLAVAGAALLGALAYVALGSKGSAQPVAVTPAAPVNSGLPVAVAPPKATAAASETPAGVQYQTQGSTRNPFTPLPGTAVASTSASPASAAKSSGASSTNGGGAASKGASTTSSSSSPSSPAPAPVHRSPAPPAKPEVLPFYSVSALFGPAPSKPGEQPALTPYEDMKRFEPLPTAKVPLLVFIGVNPRNGERAVFALVVPPILRGEGSCYPSDTHCQAVELAAGKSEELEYVKSNGETVAFELKVVKIVKRNAVAGAARAKAMRVSRAGRRALRHAGLFALG
jgi:hypothetical protein